jgi:hypothetical protein
VEQLVARNVGDEHIGPSVIVVITDRHSHSIPGTGNAGFLGDVGKAAVLVVMKQAIPIGRRFFAERGNRRAADQIDVQVPIAVIVEQGNSTGHGLDLVLVWGWRVFRYKVQSALRRNLLKANRSLLLLRSPQSRGAHRQKAGSSDSFAEEVSSIHERPSLNHCCLECVAERELDFALIVRQGAINTRATILVGITARRTELGMVEDVE